MPKCKLVRLFSLSSYVSSVHSKNSLQLFYRCLSSELILVCFTKFHFSTGTHDLYSSAHECFLELFNLLIKTHSRNLEVSMKSDWCRLCPSEICFKFRIDFILSKICNRFRKKFWASTLVNKDMKKSCNFVLSWPLREDLFYFIWYYFGSGEANFIIYKWWPLGIRGIIGYYYFFILFQN